MTNLARELKKLEYRIKPITRYVVTKYEQWGDADRDRAEAGHVSECGTFDNADMAWEVGYALCKERHQLVGWPPGDERVQYPEHPTSKGAARQSEGGYAAVPEDDGKTLGKPTLPTMTPPAGYVMLTKVEHERLVAAAGPHWITAGMTDAGVKALTTGWGKPSDQRLVTQVYVAMELARVKRQLDATLMPGAVDSNDAKAKRAMDIEAAAIKEYVYGGLAPATGSITALDEPFTPGSL